MRIREGAWNSAYKHSHCRICGKELQHTNGLYCDAHGRLVHGKKKQKRFQGKPLSEIIPIIEKEVKSKLREKYEIQMSVVRERSRS